MSFVLDNSVSMRWCFGDGKSSELEYAAKVARALNTGSALVPVIWTLEVTNILVRGEARAQITKERSAAFLKLLQSMRIDTDPDTAEYAFTETLQLARQHRLSAYDAAYLELALRRQLPLATLDKDLRKAVKRAGVDLF